VIVVWAEAQLFVTPLGSRAEQPVPPAVWILKG